MKSKSLARVHHEGKAARRRRRSHKLSRKVHANPKIHKAVWIVGGLVLLGGGYLGWRYIKQHITIAGGGTYAVPAGNITVTFSGGPATLATVVQGVSQVASGQVGSVVSSLTFAASAGGTYTAAWTNASGVPQTATITAS